jgi:dienelactone hydrolase
MRRSGLVALTLRVFALSLATNEPRHAFMNPNNKEGFPAEATTDAKQRIDRFFAEKLHANIPNS